jgi:hypothetical protein
MNTEQEIEEAILDINPASLYELLVRERLPHVSILQAQVILA